jgi:hypothetical protein
MSLCISDLLDASSGDGRVQKRNSWLIADSLIIHLLALVMTLYVQRYDLKCALSQARKIAL